MYIFQPFHFNVICNSYFQKRLPQLYFCLGSFKLRKKIAEGNIGRLTNERRTQTYSNI